MQESDSVSMELTPNLVDCLKEWGINSLTDIQKKAVEAGIPSGASAVVSAPTSSGKTLVGELALANAMASDLNALYLVSHKALAEQKYADFEDRFSSPRWQGAVTVGISTGDHEEGDVNCRLLVSTYEKALGLILAGRLKVSKTLIVADEFQLLGEDGRGAEVETLCSLLRQRQPYQFVGLTATVENPEELAAWMGCQTIKSTTRAVELIQTILWKGKQHSVRFGQDEGETKNSTFGADDIHGVVRKLLQDELGPVLVFTETRREASDLADEFSQRCQRSADGLKICKQLELFSEPTESSQQLMAHAERRVTFHTADLTPDERTVIEAGFSTTSFDVCFATSTLAAGVNFPFRTVVIPKLTYGYGDREGKLFSRSDYRNMSGRAGRLGYHEDGRVILLPRSMAELNHANKLVLPENDIVRSKMVALSMRRTVLSLVAARAISSKDELTAFFKSTFYWHQTSEHNPKLLDVILDKAQKAIEWLLEMKFLDESHGTIQTTPLGKSTAMSGLLPETAKQFVDLLFAKADSLAQEFSKYEVGLVHWALTCPEFMGEPPTRFLPWPAGQIKPESSVFMRNTPFLAAWDRSDEKITRCTHALGLFIHGEAERKIRFSTGISAGNLRRLATDLSVIIDGLRCVSGTADIGCPQVLTNNIGMLSRRVRWGTPTEAIDVLKIASQKKVPGFGRQRVMALLANGLETVIDVIAASKDRLVKLLGSKERADSLVAALSDSVTATGVRYDRVHQQLGREIGVEEKVAKCNNCLGTEYEDAVLDLLKEELNWTVEQVDDGKRQNVPDILLELGAISMLIECKTVTKKPPLIAKEDAFAVLQKAVDYDVTIRRVTLGKPDFDEHSKKKAAASSAITLVQHHVFMEGLMRVLTGRLTAQGFVEWLAEPGVTDLSRLPGTPTYAEIDRLDMRTI